MAMFDVMECTIAELHAAYLDGSDGARCYPGLLERIDGTTAAVHT